MSDSGSDYDGIPEFGRMRQNLSDSDDETVRRKKRPVRKPPPSGTNSDSDNDSIPPPLPEAAIKAANAPIPEELLPKRQYTYVSMDSLWSGKPVTAVDSQGRIIRSTPEPALKPTPTSTDEPQPAAEPAPEPEHDSPPAVPPHTETPHVQPTDSPKSRPHTPPPTQPPGGSSSRSPSRSRSTPPPHISAPPPPPSRFQPPAGPSTLPSTSHSYSYHEIANPGAVTSTPSTSLAVDKGKGKAKAPSPISSTHGKAGNPGDAVWRIQGYKNTNGESQQATASASSPEFYITPETPTPGPSTSTSKHASNSTSLHTTTDASVNVGKGAYTAAWRAPVEANGYNAHHPVRGKKEMERRGTPNTGSRHSPTPEPTSTSTPRKGSDSASHYRWDYIRQTPVPDKKRPSGAAGQSASSDAKNVDRLASETPSYPSPSDRPPRREEHEHEYASQSPDAGGIDYSLAHDSNEATSPLFSEPATPHPAMHKSMPPPPPPASQSHSHSSRRKERSRDREARRGVSPAHSAVGGSGGSFRLLPSSEAPPPRLDDEGVKREDMDVTIEQVDEYHQHAGSSRSRERGEASRYPETHPSRTEKKRKKEKRTLETEQQQGTSESRRSAQTQSYSHPPPPPPESNDDHRSPTRSVSTSHRRSETVHTTLSEIRHKPASSSSVDPVRPSSQATSHHNDQHQGHLEGSPAPRTSKLRTVTILIEDRRTGVEELAEISIPLREFGEREKDAEGGYWAAAEDVVVKLQGGPARIDGPSKVWTMRGKYRQTFLRISEAGVETGAGEGVNLKVDKNKTLAVVVEPLQILPTASTTTLSSAPTPLSLPEPPSQAAVAPPTQAQKLPPAPSPIAPSPQATFQRPLTPYSMPSASHYGSPPPQQGHDDHDRGHYERRDSHSSEKRKRTLSGDSSSTTHTDASPYRPSNSPIRPTQKPVTHVSPAYQHLLPSSRSSPYASHPSPPSSHASPTYYSSPAYSTSPASSSARYSPEVEIQELRASEFYAQPQPQQQPPSHAYEQTPRSSKGHPSKKPKTDGSSQRAHEYLPSRSISMQYANTMPTPAPTTPENTVPPPPPPPDHHRREREHEQRQSQSHSSRLEAPPAHAPQSRPPPTPQTHRSKPKPRPVSKTKPTATPVAPVSNPPPPPVLPVVPSTPPYRHAAIVNYLKPILKRHKPSQPSQSRKDGTEEATWDEFQENKSKELLSNVEMLRIYWFVQRKMEKYVGLWTPEALGAESGSKEIEMEHVIRALDLTEDWYEQCRQTLALMIRYGKGGKHYEDKRVIQTAADRTRRVIRGVYPTELYSLLQAVNEEYAASQG